MKKDAATVALVSDIAFRFLKVNAHLPVGQFSMDDAIDEAIKTVRMAEKAIDKAINSPSKES